MFKVLISGSTRTGVQPLYEIDKTLAIYVGKWGKRSGDRGLH